MYTPLVSFLCPTYGRIARQPHLINEMLYWLTLQDHAKWELVVLNDAKDQELWCKLPNVRCINLPYKVPTLGDKMNVLVEWAHGSICLPSEDDDISLPHRASQAAEMLKGFDYWSPRYWCYAERNGVPAIDGNGCGHNCSAYRRAKFLGKYASVSKGHDSVANDYALANLRVNPTPVEKSQVSYVYRWGVSDYHLSAMRDMELSYKHNAPGPPGRYELVPTPGDTDWRAVVASAAG